MPTIPLSPQVGVTGAGVGMGVGAWEGAGVGWAGAGVGAGVGPPAQRRKSEVLLGRVTTKREKRPRVLETRSDPNELFNN